MVDRTARLRAIRHEGQVTRSLMRARCHRGAEIAREARVLRGDGGGDPRAGRALGRHGQPHGLRGTEIPLAARILCLAQTVEVFVSPGACARPTAWPASAAANGSIPRLVDALHSFRVRPGFLGARSSGPTSPRSSRPTGCSSPTRHGSTASPRALPPWSTPSRRGHTSTASECARSPPRWPTRMGFTDTALRQLRRAALLHDLGKLSISNRILDKPGPLSPEERRRFREHPLLAEDILGRVPTFLELAASPARITSVSTGAATRAGWPGRHSRCRCACSPSPTCTRPSPRSGRTARLIARLRRWS